MTDEKTRPLTSEELKTIKGVAPSDWLAIVKPHLMQVILEYNEVAMDLDLPICLAMEVTSDEQMYQDYKDVVLKVKGEVAEDGETKDDSDNDNEEGEVSE